MPTLISVLTNDGFTLKSLDVFNTSPFRVFNTLQREKRENKKCPPCYTSRMPGTNHFGRSSMDISSTFPLLECLAPIIWCVPRWSSLRRILLFCPYTPLRVTATGAGALGPKSNPSSVEVALKPPPSILLGEQQNHYFGFVFEL